MASQAQRPPTQAGERALVVGLGAFAVYHLALGLLMVLDPATFFERIGPFGELNEHYIRDTATYNFAFAAGFAGAVFRPGWRLPVLVVATLQFVLHTVNHLVDIDQATPESVGVIDFVSLLVATALLAILLVLALRRQGGRRSAEGPR